MYTHFVHLLHGADVSVKSPDLPRLLEDNAVPLLVITKANGDIYMFNLENVLYFHTKKGNV